MAFGQAQRLEMHACPLDLRYEFSLKGVEAQCGFFTSLLSHDEPSRGEVKLNFLELKSLKVSDETILYLEGGPGGAATGRYKLWLDHPLREDYNIILLDQRGTGGSSPTLNCPLSTLDPILAMQRCLKNFEGDLSYFNSRESASDVALFIETLNLSEVNLLGVSYGTRLALTVMRDHPERIRSVVLDSTYPPQVDRLATLASNAERVFEKLFNLCEHQKTCARAYPGLKNEFIAAIEAYNFLPLDFPCSI
ncbi:MAG: alpha/beta hydrolase [Deinococcales bacterium]